MKKWRYTNITETKAQESGEGIMNILHRLGNDGWELVSVIPSKTTISTYGVNYVINDHTFFLKKEETKIK